MTEFAAFDRLVRGLSPKMAIVLGSGLDGVVGEFRESASVAFTEIPGFFSSTVSGHQGYLSVGLWNDVPVLLFRGRLHFYEGYSSKVVTEPVRLVAGFGVKVFVMTNAVGSINPGLKPGNLMAIRQHVKLIGSTAWQDFVSKKNDRVESPYSQRMIDLMQSREATSGRELSTGVYAALSGPSYETPAEIRALAACQVDVVGMSTALEAEAAATQGLEVAAISCVTNAAAGLTTELLNHANVLDNAKLGVERLGKILGHLVRES